MWRNSGRRGVRAVFTWTGTWMSPARRTASGLPVRPRRVEMKSFGFSASESTYPTFPTLIRCFSRVAAATSRLRIDRTRNQEAPTSHQTAAATDAWANGRSACRKETATLATIAATMEKTRIVRSAYSLSSGVTRVSARYMRKTAARIQIRAMTIMIWTTWTAAGVKHAMPRIATMEAAIAKYITVVSDSFARTSWTSIRLSSDATASRP